MVARALGIAALTCAAIALGFASHAMGRARVEPPEPITRSGYQAENLAFDRTAFRLALASLDATPSPSHGARILIVPHHWLAGEAIVAALRDVSSSADITRVALVGPDHHELLPLPGVTARSGWRTAYGLVPLDLPTSRRLLSTGLVGEDDALLHREHSIAGLVPAIAHFLPGVPVTPLAVRNDTDRGEVQVLGGALLSELDGDPGALILLSADFSHGLRPRSAAARDGETLVALEELDLDAIASFGAENVDARGALSVVVWAAREAGLTRFVLRERSDSGRAGLRSYGHYAGGPVTSYVVGYYSYPADTR